MLSGYQPRRVVREGERERPSEVDSKTDQRTVDGGGSTRWPSSTTHLSPASNPGGGGLHKPAHACLLSSGRARLFAFEEINTRLD